MKSEATSVEQYLDELPEDRREAMEAVRKTILDNLPKGYEESMSSTGIVYCVPHSVYPPGYHCDPKQPLPFVGLASQKNHMGAHKARERDEPRISEADLVETQYSGAKSDLRSIYDAIIKAVRKFGEDVEISPKKAYVSLRRSKQFAIVQPSTKTRIDVGINLKGVPTTDRLEAFGSFNSMVSHRVRLENQKDVDKELNGWLKKAHQRS